MPGLGVALLRKTAVTTLVFDDFSEANGTAINGKLADTGQAWATTGVVGAAWTVESGRLTSPGDGFAYVEAGAANVDVSVVFPTVSTNEVFGILGRFTNTSNYILVVGGSPAVDNNIYLQKVVAGVVTTLTSVSSAYVANQKLRLKMNGNSLKVFKNDVEILSTTDAAHNTVTKHGILLAGGGFGAQPGRTADDFLVVPV